MFKHRGKSRTYLHNFRLASLLSFVAGIVNITGVLSIKILTTNVTGHFAYFAEEFSNKNYSMALSFLIFILSFLCGAFVSNTFIEGISRRSPRYAYIIPMILEIVILGFLGIYGAKLTDPQQYYQLISCTLLFSMGLQNSLVTKVSQSVVRTTHLTGLFTDLGIELSQLLFYRKSRKFKTLKKSIYLKLAIILFFFLGCITGGFAYRKLELNTLLISSCCLAIALFYDYIRLSFYHLKRKASNWKY